MSYIENLSNIKETLMELGFAPVSHVKNGKTQISFEITEENPYERIVKESRKVINSFGNKAKIRVATLEFCTIEIS